MSEKSTEKKRRGLRAVQDESRFYFVLEIIFAALEALLFYTAIAQKNLQRAGLIIFIVIGVAFWMLASKGWQRSGARTLGRTLMTLIAVFFVGILLIDVAQMQITDNLGMQYVPRDWRSYTGQFSAYMAVYLQPLMIIFYLAYAIGARRADKKTDVVLMRICNVLQILLAIVTLSLASEKEPLIDCSAGLLGFVSNQVLLIAMLVCTVAALLTGFMLHSHNFAFLMRTHAVPEAFDENGDNGEN